MTEDESGIDVMCNGCEHPRRLHWLTGGIEAINRGEYPWRRTKGPFYRGSCAICSCRKYTDDVRSAYP